MDNTWNFSGRSPADGGEHRTETLELDWYLDWDSITDDYIFGEISAEDLFRKWLGKIGDARELRIRWLVDSVSEAAPFTGEDEDFLTYYTWPQHAETGEKLNWLTLPVLSKGWNRLRADKGGFIQEVTGWKPSPLQRTVHVPTLLKGCGWN